MRRVLVFASLALVLTSPAAFAAAACPSSCTTNSNSTVCGTAASRDTSTSEPCAYGGVFTTRAMFDHVAGAYALSVHACSFAGPTPYASVEGRDRFQLVGPPGGGVIVFQARLHANGGTDGTGSAGLALMETGGGVASVNEGTVGGYDTDLVLPLAHAVGEEFELVVDGYVSAPQFAQTTGTFGFTGLPAGYGLVSCKGFAGDGAVPARAGSWGAIKIRYR